MQFGAKTMSMNTYINPLTTCAAAALLNWGASNFYSARCTNDPAQKSSELKKGYLKLAIAVAAYAVKMGIGSDTPLSSDLAIFGFATGVICLTSAIKDIYSGSHVPFEKEGKELYVKSALKLGVVIAVLAGLNFSLIPKEKVGVTLLKYLKFGGYLTGASLAISGTHLIVSAYREKAIAQQNALLKGGIESIAISVPLLGMGLGIGIMNLSN